MATRPCPNCGTPAPDRYCPSCGQSQEDPRVSLGRWLRDAADELFSLNAKVPRTLELLLLRPGTLTVEWVAGRRARYLAPLRLFLAVLVVFFALFFALDLDRAAGDEGEEPRTVAELVAGDYGETPEEIATRETTRAIVTAAMFLLVPVAALILKLFHIRSGRYLVEHTVFALHLVSFGMLAVLLGWGLGTIGDELDGVAAFLVNDILFNAVLVWLVVYTGLALRRVYDLRWPRTVVETAGFFLLLIAVGMAAVLPVAHTLRVVGIRSAAGAAEDQAFDLLRQTREARSQGDSARAELLLPMAITAFHRIGDREVDRHNRYHLAELQLWAGQPFAALATAERMLEREAEDPGGLGMAGRAAHAAGRDSLAGAYFHRYVVKYRGGGRDSLVARYGHEEDFDAFAREAEAFGVDPDADSAAEGSPEHLRDEAEAIVAFLRGGRSLDPELLAESITFYVAAEGGGARRTVPKGALSDRSAWRVGGYSVVPPGHRAEASLHPGSHVHCNEAPLRSRFPSLEGTPHVGVRLAPPDFSSCLQVWNATLLFSDDAGDPVLVGVAYDQWEW